MSGVLAASARRRRAGVGLATFNTSDPRGWVLSSVDGKAFSTIQGMVPYADPDPAFVVRDPAVIRTPTGWLMAYTRAAAASQFAGPFYTWGLAKSQDLKAWAFVRDISPGIEGTLRIWAPDLMLEGSTLYCYWALDSGTRGQWVQYADLSDLSTWSTPSQVAGLMSPVIDMHLQPDGAGAYVGIVKDESSKNLHVIRGNSPLGPFAYDPVRIPTIIDGTWKASEGPYLLRLPAGTWRLYLDFMLDGGTAWMETSDFTTWTSPAYITAPAGAPKSHPSAWHLTSAELATLTA